MEMQAAFELADDILIINKSQSVLGGAFSESQMRVEIVPVSITPDDVKAVFAFFQCVAYKQVAAQFGVALELPK